MINFTSSLLWIINHPSNRNNKINTLLRLCWWKVNQWFLHIPAIINLQEGIKYIAYPDSSFGSLVVYTKLPEYYEMLYFSKQIKEGDIVIDIGAHMGDYTLLAAKNLNDGKVFSIEPSKSALKGLNENIKLNDFQDVVKVLPVAVSDINGYLDFVDEKYNETSHIDFIRNSNSIGKTRSVTIDSVIRKYKIKKVKFIKIDVEGAELKVLKGMERSLKSKIFDFILIEINRDCFKYGNTPEETFQYITSFGYNTFCFDQNGKLVRTNIYPPKVKYINIIAKLI